MGEERIGRKWRSTAVALAVVGMGSLLWAPATSASGVALAGPAGLVDWPQWHFSPDHRGFNPFETVLSPATVGGLVLGWSITGKYPVHISPAVVGGTLYGVTSGRTVYAVDAETGSLRWSRFIPTVFRFLNSPAVWRGRVFVGSDGGAVYALDAATGKLLWAYGTGGIVGEVMVAGGRVYVASDNTKVYALDARTGKEIWIADTLQGGATSPTLSGGVIYLGAEALYAIDARSGTILWTGSLGGKSYGAAAVADGLVYVGAADGTLYAFDASGCQTPPCSPVWTVPLDSAMDSTPAVANGVVFAGSGIGTLYALDGSSGAELWSTDTGGGIGLNAPVVANGVVYMGEGFHYDPGPYYLYAFDASSGSPLWTYDLGENNTVNSSPTVVNGWLYSGSIDQHTLYAFHLPG